MSQVVSAARILQGENPFEVAPDHYARLHDPDYDDPLWSETHFWSCWNPEQGVGFFIHAGPAPEDHDVWWSQVMMYLPERRVLADVSWGRAPDDRAGPATGNFRARSPELGHFNLSFDGAGELTSTDDMANRVVGAARCVPFSFEVEIKPVMPVWDLFKAIDIGEREWGGTHHEQVHTCEGWLKVGTLAGYEDYRLDGVSFRDHSIGRRDFSRLGGDHLFGGYFPDSGRALQLLFMWTNDGTVEVRTMSIWENDELELISDVEMTGVEHGTTSPNSLHRLTGEPLEFEIKLRRITGEEVVVKCEVEHSLNMSNSDPNTNLNGIDLTVGDGVLLLAESQVKLTWPDGEVGYAHLERGYRRNLLPDGAIPGS